MAIFVVQRHQATTLHFDLRLEVGGVLRSWAVPKGPSLDPAVKRLAVQVGDHELSHASFEGPTQGLRRPGSVIVWDTGSFIAADPAAALDHGHLRFELVGLRLSGEFALTRTRLGGEDRNWILVKVDDASADRGSTPVTDQLTSVLSGETNLSYERSAAGPDLLT